MKGLNNFQSGNTSATSRRAEFKCHQFLSAKANSIQLKYADIHKGVN
jgi:hypothetical protein